MAMLRKINILLLAGFLITSKGSAQNMRKLNFDQVKVELRGVSADGIMGSHPFAEGKSCGPYQLFQSDTLKIAVKYKLVSNSSRRSSVMDSSIKLKIEYFAEYKGRSTTKKSEKMYFLDDRQQFSEKDVFTFESGRFSSTVVRLSYSGRLSE